MNFKTLRSLNANINILKEFESEILDLEYTWTVSSHLFKKCLCFLFSLNEIICLLCEQQAFVPLSKVKNHTLNTANQSQLKQLIFLSLLTEDGTAFSSHTGFERHKVLLFVVPWDSLIKRAYRMKIFISYLLFLIMLSCLAVLQRVSMLTLSFSSTELCNGNSLLVLSWEDETHKTFSLLLMSVWSMGEYHWYRHQCTSHQNHHFFHSLEHFWWYALFLFLLTIKLINGFLFFLLSLHVKRWLKWWTYTIVINFSWVNHIKFTNHCKDDAFLRNTKRIHMIQVCYWFSKW